MQILIIHRKKYCKYGDIHVHVALLNYEASVFTHIPSSDANLLEQKEVFGIKSSTPTGSVWYTNMPIIALFWSTNLYM